MSYSRWSECDVYAYDSCEGGVRFWVAGNDDLNRLCGTYNEAYQYAKELRDKHGLDVPLHAIDALREDAIDEAKRYFGPDSAVSELISENTKLVDVLHEVETEAVYAYHCLQQDCMTTADSSEHFFKKWWHAECELDRLNAENAKLREVAGIVAYCMQAERDCDGCKMNGAVGKVTEPAGCDGLLDLLRELGVIQ